MLSLSPAEGRLSTHTRVFFETMREKHCGNTQNMKLSQVPSFLQTFQTTGSQRGFCCPLCRVQGPGSARTGHKEVASRPFLVASLGLQSSLSLCSTAAAHSQSCRASRSLLAWGGDPSTFTSDSERPRGPFGREKGLSPLPLPSQKNLQSIFQVFLNH